MTTVLGQSPLVTLILASIVGIVGGARLTRLIVDDAYPPVVKFRAWWDGRTEESLWNKLFHCPWCLGPWVIAVVILSGWLSHLHIAWWVFWGWLAASYVASWIVFHDED